ncbi:nuclear transport factor 2 family protein [Streptomyces sp. NPDC053079]|uniref:nuclear transport factor 2 family protein n=1 Tax=Streptomyces sp. NPDC053079 TaxID=3365697 RepID=UPI0037D6CC5B
MTTHTDHAEITMLISRFFRALDQRGFEDEWVRDYVTDDVRTTTPIGTFEGLDAVRRHTEEAVGRFARTQHITTDALVHVDAASGSATASWNALMTHVHHASTLEARGEGANPLFTVGGFWEAELRRTPDGWRFSHTSVQAVWATGEPPVLPEAVQAVRALQEVR